MRKYIAAVIVGFLAALAGVAWSQNLNVPGTIWSKGEMAVATDSNHLGSAPTGYVAHMNVYSASFTPSEVGPGDCEEQGFTVTGLDTTDRLLINGPALSGGTSPASMTTFRVSAADTAAVTFCNLSSGAVSPTSGTYQLIAFSGTPSS